MRALQAFLSLSLLLLAACNGDKVPEVVRPAIVVQPRADGSELAAFAGEVHAQVEPQLAFRVGGKIARRLVDAGARVQAGQALAELDPSDLRLQDQAAVAQLTWAKSDLDLAKTQLDRYKSLLDRQLISRAQYDAQLAQYQAAAARQRQAQAQANVSGNQANYAVLRAPAAGVIAQRLAEAGQVVAAGQPVFVLAADGDREVAISVPENAVAEFRVGRALAVELWTAPGKQLPGKLREIAPAADPLTRTYAARVTFSAPATGVELGQSARVYAQDAGNGALAVPMSAIVDKDGGSAVWVVRPQTVGDGEQRHVEYHVHLIPVRIAAYGEDSVPVLSGLKPDDWVVAAGAHLLRDDQAVRPIDRNDRAITPIAAN